MQTVDYKAGDVIKVKITFTTGEQTLLAKVKRHFDGWGHGTTVDGKNNLEWSDKNVVEVIRS